MNWPSDEERLLKLSEAAEIVRCAPDYLAKQIRLRRLAGFRVGKEWRVSRKQLDEWLQMVESPSRVA